MLKVVHASWHKKSWVENNSRKDTVEIRETERIEHGETKEEKMFAAFLRATMTFQEVRSKLRLARRWFDWRATLWNRKEKTGRVLNLTRIPEVLRYSPFVLQNMVFRSWDFFVFPKIIDWLTCTPSCTTRRWEKSSKFKTITFLKLFWFSEMTGQFLIFLNVFSNTKNVTNLKIEKPDTQFSGFFSPDLCPFFSLFNMKRNLEKLSQNEQGHRNLAFWALCFSLWTFPVLFCFTIRDSVKLSRLRELKFKLFSFSLSEKRVLG